MGTASPPDAREAITLKTEATIEPITTQPAERATTAVVGTLALASFVGMLGSFALTPFLPSIALEVGVSVALLGQVPALTNLLAAGLGLVIGPLADAIGPRRMLLIGVLFVVVSSVSIALATSYPMLLLVAILGAAGRATVLPVAQSIAGARFSGQERRRAIGWTLAGLSATAIVGIPLLTFIDALLGWRVAFGALALAAAGVAIVGQRTLPADRQPAREPGYLGGLLGAIRPLLGHRPTLGLIGWTLLGQAGITGLFTYLGAFLVQQHHLASQQVGLCYLAIGVGYLVGTLAAGGRLGHLSPGVLVVATRVVEGGLMAAGLVAPVGVVPAVLLMALSGVLGGVNTVAVTSLLASESPAGRATTMTVNGSAMSLGAAVGSSLGGLLLTLGGYPLLGLGVLTFTLASVVVVWLARRGPIAGRRSPIASEQ